MTALSLFGLQVPLLLVGGIVWCLIAVSIALWIARDASARGSDRPRIWAIASVTTPIGLPYYFYQRFVGDGISDDRPPATGRERWIQTLGIASLGAVLVGTMLAPPDPVSQVWYMASTYVAGAPLAALVVFGRERRGRGPKAES